MSRSAAGWHIGGVEDELPVMTTAAAHIRHHPSLLANLEKRLLVWIAHRLPAWMHSDHLSALGLLSMAGAGVGFW